MAHLLVTQSKPFIRHVALAFMNDGKEYVVHNSRTIGHPVMEPLAAFMSDRKLIKSVYVDLSDDEIKSYYETNKDKTYNVVSYNCEHFTSQALGKLESPQVKQYALGLALLGLLLYAKNN